MSKTDNKKECLKCRKRLSIQEFYNATDIFYSDSKFPVCKSCIERIIEGFDNQLDGLLLVLRSLDKPFIIDNYKGDYKSYIRQVNSLPQYRNKSWDDSNFGYNTTSFKTKLIESKEELQEGNIEFTEEEMQELINFWGRGFTKEDYEFLQNEYERLVNSYECDTYAMELLFQEASHQRLTIKKKREKGESVDKELKTLQDLLGSANIKPVQETGANAAEQATFGTLIKKWENERPIPEPDPQWEDVDGISKYVKAWFFGQLTKMLGMKNEFSEEYEEELEKYTVKPPQYEESEE